MLETNLLRAPAKPAGDSRWEFQEQGAHLKRVVNSFFNYFAVPTNNRAINSFFRHVGWYWFRALRRRSQTKRLTWVRMKRLTDLWLPPAGSHRDDRAARDVELLVVRP